MRTRLIAVLTASLLAAPAGAQPACATGTLAEYIGLGSAGCTYEGLRFADFSVDRTPAGSEGVILTPTAGYAPYSLRGSQYGTGFTLTFSPAFSRTAIGDAAAFGSLRGLRFSATGSESTQLRGAGVDLEGTATGGFSTNGHREAYVVASASSSAGSVNIAECFGVDCMGYYPIDGFVGPASALPGSLRLLLDAFLTSAGGPSAPPDRVTTVEITSIRLSVITTAPEPGTWALMVTGLLALAGVAARRKRPQA